MTYSGKFVMLAIGTVMLGAIAIPSAIAAPSVAGIIGSANSSVAGCPYVSWRIAKHDDGKLTGILFYSDMSDTSSVTGNEDASVKYKRNVV